MNSRDLKNQATEKTWFGNLSCDASKAHNPLSTVLLLALSTVFLSGCGGVHGIPEQQTFSYEFSARLTDGKSEVVCHTKKSFTDKNLYCEALKDDALNGNCATEQRRLTFLSEGCYGEFKAGVVSKTTDLTVITSNLEVIDSNETDSAPSESASTEVKETYAYSYSISNQGSECSTGIKILKSRAALCGALLDDVLNNDCARNEREFQYSGVCDGL